MWRQIAIAYVYCKQHKRKLGLKGTVTQTKSMKSKHNSWCKAGIHFYGLHKPQRLPDSRVGWPHITKAVFQSPKCQTLLRIEHSITCFILTSCHAKNLIYISPSVSAAALPQSLICPFCFEWRTLGNHHVRLRPKRKPTARIRRLLKRESAGKRLSAEQTAVLQKFKRASNALVRSSPPVLCPLQFIFCPQYHKCEYLRLDEMYEWKTKITCTMLTLSWRPKDSYL